MNARLALVALLTTAMLLAPPVVIADDTQDIPTNAQNTGVHDSLVAALAHAGLVEALQGQGPFTVFAPTDVAFAAAGIDLTTFDTDEENATLVDILNYHVYAGSVEAAQVTDGMTATMLNGDDATFTVTNESVMIGDATVTMADVMASNGIIHVIDKVLMPPADLVDIPTVAQGTGIHDSLVAAVIQAELLSTLQGDGPFTVFAPTDDAFTAAGVDLAALDNEEGKAALTDILLYHVISGAVPSSAVTDGMVAAAVNGDDLTFTVGEGVMVNDANVILADVAASNGIIHVIDKVLIPPVPVTEANGDICYNSFTNTIAAGASFDECMSYAYYVDYEMNGQTFTGCYNLATHTLTTVSQEECEAYIWTPAMDIAMTAQSTTILNSLVAALAQAELVATVQGDGPFTVFAPTDDAFDEAGIDLTALDNEEGKALLTDILLYHVVSGAVPSSAVTDGLVAAAVNGDDLTFYVGEGVMVNDANVVLADVPASNGVIHVIDKVLIPPAEVDTSECDVIIGIDDTGLAYDKPYVEVEVGATVCWIWNDESMAHNVAQIALEGDTTRYMSGVYSGESMKSVDFRYTFDVDQTFNYICVPHATSGMAGQIVVGEGSIVEPEEESNNTPGFSAGIAALAVIGALMIAGRRLR
jgi:transforming growth factor-beta-induced protein